MVCATRMLHMVMLHIAARDFQLQTRGSRCAESDECCVSDKRMTVSVLIARM
eukprot:CAMPEP_0119101060 /NCGR_PEP_ID=MMETSP1180-20130426/194_1 /TAXON_ID=3052 ORGANISM="Chlamydomonas cf sp, Strain CCMP681" /NCGR_SAMPLE_ID=MMETSP1180 /ASSEMBLY_ACC=CAM_ASM_000741 /LENGTH=51 /DNA_ID=CAMNT_0007085099 /DNA_START=973 /DNA_END=1125 /DNA_ORIENTATION=-